MIWGDLGKVLFPVLILTFTLNLIDAFFWTLGPIFAENLPGMKQFAGFFMTAYSLPALVAGWSVGTITRRFGKKRTAFVALLIGACILSLLPLASGAPVVILTVFLAASFISITWPSINGAYADYISETPKYEKEISGLQDFFTNIGYVVGPILAGIIAGYFGNSQAFSFLGVFAAVIAIVLIAVTPENINVNRGLKKLGAEK